MDLLLLLEYLIIFYTRKIDISCKKKIFLIRFFSFCYYLCEIAGLCVILTKDRLSANTVNLLKKKTIDFSREISLSFIFGKIYTKIFFLRSVKNCISFFDDFF
jgi:hypothetical protein